MTGGIVIGLALVVAAAATGEDATLKSVAQVRVAELRVGDLVEAPLPARVASLVVARLPRGVTELDMPAADVAALVRRRVPGLRLAVPAGGKVRIRAVIPERPLRVAGECFAAAAAIPAGAALTAGDVAATACRKDVPAVLRYDRAGLVVAIETVPAGGYLGRLARLPGSAVGKGKALTLRSTAGPVTVERRVTAMQSGRSGNKLFVRDSEGKVFAAPLALVQPGGAR